MSLRRRHASRGVTIVEAAFAFPILLTFIFGLVDLGMWTFNANQATNAARDGARLGILDYKTAESGTQHEAIVAAVRARLEDAKVQAEDVDVRCVDPDGTSVACSTATVDVHRIRVEVEWAWDLVTPVATILGYDRGAATGSATMKIVGRPLPPSSTSATSTTTTTAPPGCAVSSLTVPTSVARTRKNGSPTRQLASPVLVEFVTNGSAACTDLRVMLQSADDSSGNRSVSIDCGCDYEPRDRPNYFWSYDGSDNIWSKAGTAYARVFNGSVLLKEATFQIT